MLQVDLHVHSTRSDGTYAPARLVDHAMEKGLAAFALTDHDTVDGLEEAVSYAEELRRKYNAPQETPFPRKAPSTQNAPECPLLIPEVVPGIELSTEYQGQDVHILGFYIDYHRESFTARLQEFVDSRTLRNQKMCRLLRDAGIDITCEALLREFPDSVITRAHYAKYLLQRGYVKSIKEAFERYVGDRCPCFVPREKVTPVQAVTLILDADGIPVLAHPILYHMSDERLDTLTAELKAAGLLGIEAVYSSYKPCEERQMRALAKKYDLLLSGGSDFHGDNKPGLDMGTGYGSLFVPYEILANLKGSRIQ